MSLSNGWHDTLSVFYVDSIPLNTDDLQQLKSTLRLYNIRYLVVTSSFIDSHFYDETHFKIVAKTDDIVFFEVLQSGFTPSAYFDMVHLPGFIDGNLNHVRETVLDTLNLYAVNSLFYINPRPDTPVRKQGLLNVQVSDFPKTQHVLITSLRHP